MFRKLDLLTLKINVGTNLISVLYDFFFGLKIWNNMPVSFTLSSLWAW